MRILTSESYNSFRYAPRCFRDLPRADAGDVVVLREALRKARAAHAGGAQQQHLRERLECGTGWDKV